jgi:hypothetical protein
MEFLAIIAVSEIYDVCASICFVSEGQITQPATVNAGEVVTERKSGYLWLLVIVMLSLRGEKETGSVLLSKSVFM